MRELAGGADEPAGATRRDRRWPAPGRRPASAAAGPAEERSQLRDVEHRSSARPADRSAAQGDSAVITRGRVAAGQAHRHLREAAPTARRGSRDDEHEGLLRCGGRDARAGVSHEVGAEEQRAAQRGPEVLEIRRRRRVAASATRSFQPGPFDRDPGRQPRGDVVERQRQRDRTPAAGPPLADHADRLAARVEQRSAAVAVAQRRVASTCSTPQIRVSGSVTTTRRRPTPRRPPGAPTAATRSPARTLDRVGQAQRRARRRPRRAAAPHRARRRSARIVAGTIRSPTRASAISAQTTCALVRSSSGVTKNAEPGTAPR